MMKKTMVATVSFLSSILVLSGCGSSTSSTMSIVQSIESAAEKNAELDNARFETLFSTKGGPEQINQTSAGSFVKKTDSDYDWHQKTSFVGENTAEVTQINGKQYQKIRLTGQEEAPWVETSSTGFPLQDLLDPLFENDLVESEITESQVEEQEEGMSYKLILSDTYADRLKARNVEEIQRSIDELKQENEEATVIQELETQLQEIKNTDYQDLTITYEINDEDFLTVVHSESTVVPSTGESYTFVTRFSLTEYNLSDTDNLLPQITEQGRERLNIPYEQIRLRLLFLFF